MEPRMEEKNRFRIDELEARIAPGAIRSSSLSMRQQASFVPLSCGDFIMVRPLA